MKALKVISIVLFLTGVFLFPLRSPMADSEVPQFQNYIQVTPHAQGTRVPGTVTIYYERLYDKKGRPIICSTGPGTGSYSVNMYFFIRLVVGGAPEGFSGREPNICLGDFGKQITTIDNFIKNQVFPGSVLRSYTNFVQDDQLFPYCSTSPCPFFSMMDIELAVQ